MKPQIEESLAVTHRDAEVLAKRYEDREMLETLKQTVCKGATDAQFKMFVEVCRTTGLNPFLKEIWYVPSVGVMAGRDGYLRVANEHPMFDGMETLVERDSKNEPIKATCKVWRKDRSHPITCEAYYNEYKKSGNVWSTYKSAMIGKVAEVLALKRSFSINGVVTEEEIGPQAPPEPRGSVEAAKEIGEAKVKALLAGATRREVENMIEAETEPVPTELEGQLQASLEQAEKAKEKSKNFKMLENFKLIKAEIGKEEYYRILSYNGFEKSNQITDIDQGRKIYVQMGKRLAEMRLEAVDRAEAEAMAAQ